MGDPNSVEDGACSNCFGYGTQPGTDSPCRRCRPGADDPSKRAETPLEHHARLLLLGYGELNPNIRSGTPAPAISLTDSEKETPDG